MESYAPADRWNADTVSIESDPADDAAQQVANARLARVAEAERVHQRDRATAHGEDVSQDATHPGRGALKRLDGARVVVGLNLHDRGQPIADVHGAGVLAGALEHLGA